MVDAIEDIVVIGGVEHYFSRYSDGTQCWYLKKTGRYHRENGPALIGPSGEKFWYLHGNMVTETEFNKILIKKRLKRL